MLDLMEANVQLGTLFLAYPTKLLPLLDEAVRDMQVRNAVSARVRMPGPVNSATARPFRQARLCRTRSWPHIRTAKTWC